MKLHPFPIAVFSLHVFFSPSILAQDKHNQKDDNEIEKLIITASPMARSILESATPVSILSGEELDQNQAATLGETLKNVPGVHSTYFGPVSSSPIIRGLDGPRIKVVQNGLDSSDASRVGPDHIATVEASTATQIEVLRGPATLLYGSGAIGGVVNIVDKRLPRERQEELSGEMAILHDSVSSEDTISGELNGGQGNFAWHADGYSRKTENYKIPGPAEIGEQQDSGELDNSAIDAQGYTLGAGWIGDDINVAVSYGRLESDYGIPGHSHEEEHGEDVDHEEEEAVFARLKQDRYQGIIDWKNLQGLFTEVHWHSAYTDYEHSEIEDGEVGTTFGNTSLESRLWTKHKALNGWEGVIGLHYTDTDFSALGEEAFTPATKSDTLALFVLEEKRVGDILWQLGARVENIEHKPDNNFFVEQHESTPELDEQEISFDYQSYTTTSMSAGLVWTLDKSRSLAVNFARSERAPSAAEIFSNGLHISTSTFELGAGFDIETNGEDFEVVKADRKTQKEVSNNLDLTFRLQGENVSGSVSLFYNQIDDYLYQQETGLFTSEEHTEDDHVEDAGEFHEDEEGLPIFIFRQRDATLYGFEVEFDWHINSKMRLDTFADFTRAKLDNTGQSNENAPRIPPLRMGAELHWENDNWHAEFGATYYATQDNFARFETQTDGYTLVSAAANYYISLPDADLTLYLKGNNLSDQEARVHSSFLKDDAPLPGRSIVLGARLNF
ncbi:MAG: iron complex outermembrane receptor protein [Paraglaciecola sp.]|jgi:iron complex outermembrane receptor protein